MEEELSKAKQECQECLDYMDSFTVQINSKITKLDIEKEELQRVRDKLARSEDMVQVLERSNEALGASNEVIITDNIVFHDKIRRMTKQVEQAAAMRKDCNNKPPKLEMMLQSIENTWGPSPLLLGT
jgi:DNA repair ATPase RecN